MIDWLVRLFRDARVEGAFDDNDRACRDLVQALEPLLETESKAMPRDVIRDVVERSRWKA